MALLIRTWNLTQAALGRLLHALERRNPEALLELEKEKLRKLISRYNEGLVSHAALSERLIAQVRRGEAEQADTAAKVRALLKAGNETAAAQAALRLKRVTQRLAEDRQQLIAAEETYEGLLRARDDSVAEVRANIEDVRRDIGDLKVKRAVADLESMAAAMVSELGAAGDSFSRLREMVGEEREKSAARARVAGTRFNAAERAQSAAEQSALAEEALAEFRQRDAAEHNKEPRVLTDRSQVSRQSAAKSLRPDGSDT